MIREACDAADAAMARDRKERVLMHLEATRFYYEPLWPNFGMPPNERAVAAPIGCRTYE